MKPLSANFEFLRPHGEQLVRFGALAERYFKDDPNTSLIKARQFGEVLAQLVAARSGFLTVPDEAQSDLLRRLKFERVVPQQAADLFHQLRIAGNRAAHDHTGSHAEALASLKFARALGVWFHRTFGGAPTFAPGPFVPPADPEAPTKALQEELQRLRSELDESRSSAEKARAQAEEQARARLSAEEIARKEADDRAVWEQLAAEADQAKTALAAQLATVQAAAPQTAQATTAIIQQAEAAAEKLDIDEASTRVLIDAQLAARGWQVDTQKLRYALGARPAKGKSLAIAEWPTKSGPADYALFVGLHCIGVVEAKRRNKNVSACIDQSERYSMGFRFDGGAAPVDGPWTDATGVTYNVPFLFSANGRPYLKQLQTSSGIWFRDARRSTNLRRVLIDWPTPDGLRALLDIDVSAAERDLKARPVEFAFPLRPYQKKAIEIVEEELAKGNRSMLLAMATGTGKTKLSIAMLYRLLAAKRFRRICFVVDRTALGSQAAGEFETTRIVSAKTFADIFGLQGLETVDPDPETRVHICTIQGLVRRVLFASDPEDAPPIDQYDLMVVDECHRGYLLDRELSDAELAFKNQDDYVSKYRRVLEYFDAVKVGLTATPALHTVDIFGHPVFRYSYREAVIDAYLVDHEPPIQITTALSAAGIKFQKGEHVEHLDPRTGQVDLTQLPDEVSFEVDQFNKAVITEPFNRAVARELAKHIDPTLPGKTLVFAVSDAHADIVVNEVKDALKEAYGEIDDAAVKKITGSVDRPGAKILAYRNDAMPKIAVTVDLLTTGIDVPSIANLVFLRRVNSRILYEQMLGRATRLCPEIGKESFRIFDAVDLYRNLQELTDMKPVVVDPSLTLATLFDELTRVETEAQQELVRDQIVVLMRRRLRRLTAVARAKFEVEASETPEQTLARLKTEPLATMVAWARARPGLGLILDSKSAEAQPTPVPISHHPDEVIDVSRGYGQGQKPADFLDSFTHFIRTNVNKIAALTVVLQRPRELTRAELKALRLALDGEGFSEASLRRAWSEAKNVDIAASIIGFVRQAAIGDALTPFDVRVKNAMQRIHASKSWTDVQRKWLKRIEEQLLKECVVDRAAIDDEPFRADGGFQRLNKIFGGSLEAVLADINEEVWKTAA